MVGIAEHVGHAMTYKALTEDTHKVIYHCNLQSASSNDPNLHVALLGEESSTHSAPSFVIRSHHDDDDGESKDPNMPVFHPIDLIGWTFLLEPHEYGQHFHARIVKAIEDHEQTIVQDPNCLKFLCSINNDTLEEVMSYNDIIAHIQHDEESTIVWKFRRNHCT